MSQQVWTIKSTQDLKPGDLIPGQAGISFALKIKSVETKENVVIVHCYKDLYKLLPPHEFHMAVDQHVPVAVSGVKHMDIITTFVITEEGA